MKPTPRTHWGAVYGRGSEDPGPEPRVVIHHSYRPALAPTASEAAEIAAVRAIERYHVLNNGWDGIGYNFLVAPSGRTYEGRGWKYRGAHAGPVNGQSIGVCLLINGNVTPPTAASVEAVRELIRQGLAAGEITASYTISGHRDHMPRECPGDAVYAVLPSFRHDAGPEVPWVVPEIAAPPVPHPAEDDRVVLTPGGIARVLRQRGITAEQAAPGLHAAEAWMRGALAEAGDADVQRAADALADWIRARGR